MMIEVDLYSIFCNLAFLRNDPRMFFGQARSFSSLAIRLIGLLLFISCFIEHYDGLQGKASTGFAGVIYQYFGLGSRSVWHVAVYSRDSLWQIYALGSLSSIGGPSSQPLVACACSPGSQSQTR